MSTAEAYDHVLAQCRSIYIKKMKDYVIENQQMVSQRDFLRLSLQTAENAQNYIEVRQKLTEIDGIGLVMAEDIRDFFAEEHNQKLLAELLQILTVQDFIFNNQNQPLKGKTFVFTGTISMPRDEAKARVQELGGKVSSSVSAKTSYVVAGSDPGTKYENALKLGISILNEENFKKLLDEAIK